MPTFQNESVNSFLIISNLNFNNSIQRLLIMADRNGPREPRELRRFYNDYETVAKINRLLQKSNRTRNLLAIILLIVLVISIIIGAVLSIMLFSEKGFLLNF